MHYATLIHGNDESKKAEREGERAGPPRRSERAGKGEGERGRVLLRFCVPRLAFSASTPELETRKENETRNEKLTAIFRE